ncbi:MAG: M56 family metallopeptidase [Chitinophagaceae bacterium]
MPLLFLQSVLPEGLLKAVCWTLLHSLWQGALAAALAGMVILATRQSAARLRYNLLCGIALLFLVTTGITFGRLAADIGSVQKPVSVQVYADTGSANNGIVSETTIAATGIMDRLADWLDAHAGLVVLGWFAFFLFHCLKITTGLAGVRRLRCTRTTAVGDWQVRLNQLSSKLGVRQTVRLLQSELVKVPVAIGFFKPVILIPLGLLAQLPPEQAETILLHELAHIRRKDYLVNLVQRAAEALFFFNPGLLWLSSLIRHEREACCDDIVVAHTALKANYLEALVSFQEYSLFPSPYAMGIGGKKHHLLSRVKRMLTRENKKLNNMEKLLLVAGLVTIMAFSFIPGDAPVAVKPAVPSVKEPVQPRPPVLAVAALRSSTPAAAPKNAVTALRVVPAAIVRVAADTVPAKISEYDGIRFPSISTTTNDDGTTRSETTTVTDQNGKTYTVTKLNQKITSLVVDGKTVTGQDIDNYSSLLQQIESAVHQRHAGKQRSIVLRQQEHTIRKSEQLKRQTDMNRQKIERNREITERKREITERNRQVQRDQKRTKLDLQRKIDDRKRQARDSVQRKTTELRRRVVYGAEINRENKREFIISNRPAAGYSLSGSLSFSKSQEPLPCFGFSSPLSFRPADKPAAPRAAVKI